MAISYPPIIEGSLPAFYDSKIIVPFTMNRAVSISEIAVFQIRISSISSNLVVIEKQTDIELKPERWDKDKSTIEFRFTDSQKKKLIAPNHYKIQIAYGTRDKNNIISVGPYSTVGISKYTHKPDVTISTVNNSPYSIMGKYQTNDPSEKLYSSYFKVIDSHNQVFLQTDKKIHNAFDDTSANIANEFLNIIKVLDDTETYRAKFYIETINGIKLSSDQLEIREPQKLPLLQEFSLEAVLNYENGYINLQLTSGISKISGKYKLARADSLDNFESWTNLLDFEFSNTKFPIQLWKDFTVEQGVTYKYAIFKYNNSGFFSNKRMSSTIFVDFEDMFLYDGKKQLKIKYNSKVSSIKNTILETKQDTMGGKYPFIFRNGYVNYKEFPISGLISYLADEEDLFLDKANFLIDSSLIDSTTKVSLYNTNLTGENIFNERQFKLKVLEWLTNGEPKILRTPSEGNYFVRLMNASLSPVSDGLNRLIHNFSATAYEIDDFNLSTLLKNNFITSDFILPPRNFSSMLINLTQLNNNTSINLIDQVEGRKAYNALFYTGGETLKIKINENEIQVYNGYVLSDTEITSISGVAEQSYSTEDAVVLKYYPDLNPLQPDEVDTIDTTNIPCYQAFGKSRDGVYGAQDNLLAEFKDVDTYISSVYNFKVTVLPVIEIYKQVVTEKDSQGNLKGVIKYYSEKSCTNQVKILPNLIYRVNEKKNNVFQLKGFYYRPAADQGFQPVSAKNKKTYTLEASWETIDKKTVSKQYSPSSKSYFYNDIPTSFYATPGICLEIAGRLGVYNFGADQLNPEVKEVKQEYQTKKENFEKVDANKTEEEKKEEEEVIKEELKKEETQIKTNDQGAPVMVELKNEDDEFELDEFGRKIFTEVREVVETVIEKGISIVNEAKSFVTGIYKEIISWRR